MIRFVVFKLSQESVLLKLSFAMHLRFVSMGPRTNAHLGSRCRQAFSSLYACVLYTIYVRTRKYANISVGTSSSSSSFTARFYKGSLKVSQARARLDHKITKLGKARARNVQNEPDFCLKFIKKSSSSARSMFGLGSNLLVHILKKPELARLMKFTARANTNDNQVPSIKYL